MPQEVSDIKQFIEICRRKDAKCTLSSKPTNISQILALQHHSRAARFASTSRSSVTKSSAPLSPPSNVQNQHDNSHCTSAPTKEHTPNKILQPHSQAQPHSTIMRRSDSSRTEADTKRSTAAAIKKNRKSNQIKFKVRCHRYLYTLVLKDADKADKLKQSLPPGTMMRCSCECCVKGYCEYCLKD